MTLSLTQIVIQGCLESGKLAILIRAKANHCASEQQYAYFLTSV